jgi:rhodanese-related sulfurtransferase
MKTIKVLLSITLIAFIWGCSMKSIPEEKAYDSVEEMITEARSLTEDLSIDDFHTLMNSDSAYILIDVRLPEEHKKGFIPGSVSIPRGVIEFRIASEKIWDEEGMYVPEKNEMLVLYCKKSKRGALAALALKQLGYTNVKNITGGWTDWKVKYPEIKEDKIEAGAELGAAAEEEDSGGC